MADGARGAPRHGPRRRRDRASPARTAAPRRSPSGLVYVAVAGPRRRRRRAPLPVARRPVGEQARERRGGARAAARPGPRPGRPRDGPRRGRGRRRARARPRRPGRSAPGERIHVVGAQGAGASAAALLAAWAGAEVDGCDPGGPSPYTPAARGRRRRRGAGARRRARRPAPAPGAARRDQGAHGDRPRPRRSSPPRARPGSRWSRGSRSSRTPRPAGSWSRSRGRTARARRRAGWSTCWRAAGTDPGAFVGALLPAALTGIGVAGHGAAGRGRAVRGRGGRVRRQLRPVPARRDRADLRRVGPPRRVRGPGGGARGVRGAGSGGPPRDGRRSSRDRSWSPTSAMRASRRWSGGSPTGRAGSW